jgi:hypothetical protein
MIDEDSPEFRDGPRRRLRTAERLVAARYVAVLMPRGIPNSDSLDAVVFAERRDGSQIDQGKEIVMIQAVTVRRGVSVVGMVFLIVAALVAGGALGVSASGGATVKRVVIEATSFHPAEDGCKYEFRALAGANQNPGILRDESFCTYVAPVSLPNGATVTRVAWFYDSRVEGSDGFLVLTRHQNNGQSTSVATVGADQGCSAPCFSATTDISNGTVDTSSYYYALRMTNGFADATSTGFSLLKVVILLTVG